MIRALRTRSRAGVLALTAACATCSAALLTACGGDVPPARAADLGARSVDTLVTTGSAVLGQVSDLLVGADGSVFVADAQANGIHVLDSVGRFVRTVGHAGAGPGEFQRPTSLLFVGDTLAVVDSGNGRVQLLGVDGRVRGTRAAPGGFPPPVFAVDGSYARPTLSLDTTLATVYEPDGGVRARLGHIVGAPSHTVNPGTMKRRIQAREVPEIFLNTAEPTWGADGSLFLVVPARGTIERFDSSGGSQWLLTLEDSLFPRVKDEFVQRNAADERRFTPLRYVLAARAVGDELWLLLGQSAYDRAAIAVVDAHGVVIRRITFPDISKVDNFALDVPRSRIYFSTAESAEILRTRLPEAR